MSNTYIWLVDVNGLECFPSVDGETNVVTNVHWRVNGTDGNGHNATVYGVQPLTYTAGSPFIAYDNLTLETVISWVQNAMGATEVASIQSNLNSQIAALANPTIITPNLPWMPK